MGIFARASDKRNKVINKNVNKLVRKMKREIEKAARKGNFSVEVNICDAGVRNLHQDIIDAVCAKSMDVLNSYYNGEVKMSLTHYGRGSEYERMRVRIVKG